MWENCISVEILKFHNSDTSSDYVRLHKSLESWKNPLSLLSPFLLALPTFFSAFSTYFSAFLFALLLHHLFLLLCIYILGMLKSERKVVLYIWYTCTNVPAK